MKKWKIKIFFKNVWMYISFAFQLPHFITFIILLICAVVSLLISINTKNEMASSIMANIFAGLVTGIAICLISGLRGLTIYRIKCKIDWLVQLHNECIEFFTMHRELIGAKIGISEDLYDKMYDTICKAAGINSTITQSQFNKKLSFNAMLFCEEKLNYDIKVSNELFVDTREKIINIDTNNVTKRDIIQIFSEVDRTIFLLNGAIVNKLDELKTQQNMVNKFFI